MGVMFLPQWAWKAERQVKDYSRGLRAHAIAPLGFQPTWDLSLLSSFVYFPLGKGMSIVCLSHCYSLEAYNLLVSQVEKKFASE